MGIDVYLFLFVSPIKKNKKEEQRRRAVDSKAVGKIKVNKNENVTTDL